MLGICIPDWDEASASLLSSVSHLWLVLLLNQTPWAPSFQRVQCSVSSPENQCHWFQPESSQHWPEMFHLIGFIFCCTKYSFSRKLVGFSVKKGCNQTGQRNYTWTSTLCGFEVLIVTLFLIQHFLDLFEQKVHFECKKNLNKTH